VNGSVLLAMSGNLLPLTIKIKVKKVVFTTPVGNVLKTTLGNTIFQPNIKLA
tara:strand:+ start:134 stop:289 length:156 start_codon:yes stop_codon:yes gene_type:complete